MILFLNTLRMQISKQPCNSHEFYLGNGTFEAVDAEVLTVLSVTLNQDILKVGFQH